MVFGGCTGTVTGGKVVETCAGFVDTRLWAAGACGTTAGVDCDVGGGCWPVAVVAGGAEAVCVVWVGAVCGGIGFTCAAVELDPACCRCCAAKNRLRERVVTPRGAFSGTWFPDRMRSTSSSLSVPSGPLSGYVTPRFLSVSIRSAR